MVAPGPNASRPPARRPTPRSNALVQRPSRGGPRRPQSAELQASSTARAKTASSIGSVRRPVNVFCWLGWNEHSSVGPPASVDLDAVTEPRPRPHAELRGTPPRRRTLPRHTTTRDVAEHVELAAQERRGRCRARPAAGLLPGGAHFTAAVTQASASAQAVVDRHRRRLVGEPGPVHRRGTGSRRERSPVNTRPGAVRAVRGRAQARARGCARPGRRTRARPRPSTSSSRNAARFVVRDLLAPLDEAGAGPAVDDLDVRSRPARCAWSDPRRSHSRLHGRQSCRRSRRNPPDPGTTGAPRPPRPDADDRHAAARPRTRPAPRRRGRPSRPQRAAERIAELKRVDAVYCLAARADTGDGGADRGRTRPARPQVDKGLLECDFGEWTGAELKKLMKLPEWGTVQRSPSTFRFPAGESFAEMQHRIVTTLDRLRAEHPGGTIVCVSHADPIKAAVAHAIGTHLDLFQRIVVSAVLGQRDRDRQRRAGRADRQLHRRLARGAAAVMSACALLRVRRGRCVHDRRGRPTR